MASRASAAPTLTTLVSFTGAGGIGSLPEGGLTIDAAGNLYGTTNGGGTGGQGTLFAYNGSAGLTTLAAFAGANGATPTAAPTVAAGGALYGTTEAGGANGRGTVYSFTPSAGLTTVATFTGTSPVGSNPYGGLVADAAGNLYGTTETAGANGKGTVFQVAAGTNVLTTVAPLSANADGSGTGGLPYAGLTAGPGGNLYGTGSNGGPNNAGAIFAVNPSTGTAAAVAYFGATAGVGSSSYAPLAVDANGNLYGTTSSGGGAGNRGALFAYNGSAGLTVLASFNGGNGASPYGGVIVDAAGDLFGTTLYGGANNVGTVYEYSPTAGLTTLASFAGSTNGSYPEYGTLAVDAAGDLYGTTVIGGSANKGTIFEITNSGYVTAVPEPTAVAATVVAAAWTGLARRRRRRR